MSDIIETVVVVRRCHPDGRVTINKCDMTDKDKLYTPRKTRTTKPKLQSVSE